MQLSLKRCKQYVSSMHRVWCLCIDVLSSFELGGEKKTKGAALQFVSTEPLPCFTNAHCPCSDRLTRLATSSRYLHPCYPLPLFALYVVCTHHAYATQVTKLYSYGSEWSPWTTACYVRKRKLLIHRRVANACMTTSERYTARAIVRATRQEREARHT